MATIMERKIFNAEHKMFRNSISEFIEKEIAPNYDEWEKNKQIPKEVWKKLGDLGGLCPMAEEKYGGLGGDYLFQTIVTEELSYRGFSGLLVAVHNDLVNPYIDKFGTEEQKEKWLPKMISGEMITGLAMTEPSVGSNLAGIQTKATKKKNKYIVNGAKTFISNGQNGDLFVTAVRTTKTGMISPDPRWGISMLAIPSDAPGFARGRNLDKIGFHSQDTSELFFQDAEIPVENLIGEKNKGWMYMMENLQTERIALAVGAVAAAKGALNITKEYVQTRKIFNSHVIFFCKNFIVEFIIFIISPIFNQITYYVISYKLHFFIRKYCKIITHFPCPLYFFQIRFLCLFFGREFLDFPIEVRFGVTFAFFRCASPYADLFAIIFLPVNEIFLFELLKSLYVILPNRLLSNNAIHI